MPTWILSKWALRAYVVMAVLAAALAARHHYISLGKDQGRTEVRLDVSQAGQKQVEAQRKDTAAVVVQENQREAKARAEADAAGARARQAEQRAQALEQKLKQAAATVAETPDPLVHMAIVHKLGRAEAAIQEPGYTATEERTILLAVQQNEVYYSQLMEFRSAVDELKAQVDKLDGAQTAAAAREKKKDEYTAVLEGKYVEAFNMLQAQKRRSPWTIFCLRMCGRPKHVDLPDLDALRGPP